ncbi:CHAT domain-containing protein [Haladaptatus sp. DFWS20]|uniref:CHAT domain-containing protein n=1 Tax=Haladaptatus sp. DFWS20 TaxID=3403467 RepID=UPI003EC1150E
MMEIDNNTKDRVDKAQKVALETNQVKGERLLDQIGKDIQTNFSSVSNEYIYYLERRLDIYLDLKQYFLAEEIATEILGVRGEEREEEDEPLQELLVKIRYIYIKNKKFESAKNINKRVMVVSCQTDDDFSFALDISALALIHSNLAKYDHAERLYKTAIRRIKQLLGEHNSSLFTIYSNLLDMYLEIGDHSKSVTVLTQVESLLNQNDRELESLGSHLLRLSEFYRLSGDFEISIQYCLSGLRNHSKSNGQESIIYARGIGILGTIYSDMGYYQISEKLHQRALHLQNEILGEINMESPSTLNNLGSVSMSKGNFEQAESLFLESIKMSSEFNSFHNPTVETATGNLANLYFNKGEYKRAEKQYRQLIRNWEKTERKSVDYGIDLSNFAQLYLMMGDSSTALEYFQKALDIHVELLGENHPICATDLHNIAITYINDSRYQNPHVSEYIFKKSIKIKKKILGPYHPSIAETLSQLAYVYYSQNKLSKAEICLERAYMIQKRFKGDRHPYHQDTAKIISALSYVKFDLMNRDRWWDIFSKYESWSQEPNLDDHQASYQGLYHRLGIGEALPQEVNQESKRLAKLALEIEREVFGNDHQNVAWSLIHLARISALEKNQREAVEYLKEAVLILNKNISQILSIQSDEKRLSYLESNKIATDQVIWLSINYLLDNRDALSAVYDLVLHRKGIATEASKLQRTAILAGRYPHLTFKLQKLNKISDQIALKTFQGPKNESTVEYQNTLKEWEEEKYELDAELSREIVEKELDDSFFNLNPITISGALPPKTILLEFVEYESINDRQYVVFVVDPDSSELIKAIPLGEADSIDELIRKYLEGTYTGNSLLQNLFQVYGIRLREKIFDPININGCERIIIAPDSDLHTLPFEILPDEKEYLIDSYKISYLNTGRELLPAKNSSPSTPSKPLVIGAPNYNLGLNTSPKIESDNPWQTINMIFKPLSGAKKEADKIAKLLHTDKIVGNDAREKEFKQILSPKQISSHQGSPQIIHIATHGFYLPIEDFPGKEHRIIMSSPMLRSGLAFAGANTVLQGSFPDKELGDGLLSAEEILWLDLLETELVVLSACGSGLGDRQVGEGIFGLRRAFILSGVGVLVMTLWPIDDKITQKLLVEFYENLKTGVIPTDALRSAQLKIKSEHPAPLHWGAFICQGNLNQIKIN